jgi:ABC-2 type transport system ATP-binding protein
MIEVDKLVKNYGATRAVDGVSFQVRPGEVVGLLGPNGAGKSTTLRVLTGFLPPTEGSVRLGGVDVREDSVETRRRVGYLSETNPLYESLSVYECLELTASLRGLPEGRGRLLQAAAECSLRDVLAKDIGALSKGYRQRVGLAMAILHDPEILVLDEPTSALDPNQQQEVRELILKLKRKKTVLLSTHILSEAEALCDRLLIIHRGRIAAEGTVAELQGRAAGEAAVYVRLMGRAEDILPRLRGLPGVSGAELLDEKEPGCPGFRVTAADDPRGALVELARSAGWPLMELRRLSASLDEIFRSLTGGGA